jgi:RimJ/RimL family protein N-acetyltransferase
MHVFLETERLVLRRFTEDDIDNLVDLDGDPDVMYFINGGVPTPRDMMQNRILPMFLGYYDRYEGFGFWAAIEKSSGEFLGWFCLRPEENKIPDNLGLGYRLRKSAWGKGYATEGARALIHKAFVELGVQRVFARTYEHNLASRRVMEKAGLGWCGHFNSRPRISKPKTHAPTRPRTPSRGTMSNMHWRKPNGKEGGGG